MRCSASSSLRYTAFLSLFSSRHITYYSMKQPVYKPPTQHTFLLWPGCIGIIVGIIFSHNVSPIHSITSIPLILSGLMLYIGIRYYCRIKTTPIDYTSIIFFCIGILSCYIQQIHYDAHATSLTQQKWIKGIVTTHTPTANGPFAYKTELKVKPRQAWHNFFSPTYTIMLFHSDNEVSEEQRLIFHKRNLAAQSNPAPSMHRYALKQHRLANAFIRKGTCIIKEPAPTTSLFHQIKTGLDRLFKKKLSPQTYLIYASLFLGKKIPETQRWLRNLCAQWGISHFLARSGLHLVIYLLVWHLMLMLLPITLQTRTAITMALLLSYHFLTWQSISFTRALTVALLFCFAALKKRQGSFLHLLSLVFLLILIINPAQLFALDFQLTFALTFALSIGMNTLPRIATGRTIAPD